MPRIKAFCGIRPAKEWADRVITVPPDFPLDEAVVTHLKKNPVSFFLLVPPFRDIEFIQGSLDPLVSPLAGGNLKTFRKTASLFCFRHPSLSFFSIRTSFV